MLLTLHSPYHPDLHDFHLHLQTHRRLRRHPVDQERFQAAVEAGIHHAVAWGLLGHGVVGNGRSHVSIARPDDHGTAAAAGQ